MGSARAGHGARDGCGRRIHHRYLTLLSRDVAAPRLSQQFILQEMAARARRPADRQGLHGSRGRRCGPRRRGGDRDHGCQVFPDSAAADSGENPQWLYTVVFDGAELWGPDADPTVKISIDAFEPYLEAAWWTPRRRARPGLRPAFPAMMTARYFANRGRHRPLRWRSRCMNVDCSPGTNGRPLSPHRSSAPRPPAIP